MSKSPTPTNTDSPSRKSTPTHQRHSTGNRHYEAPTNQPTALISNEPGPSSKRRRLSTGSEYDSSSKRARLDLDDPTQAETMRWSPSVDSNDGTDDYPMDSQHRHTTLPPAPSKTKRTRTLTTAHQSAVLHSLLAQSKFPTTAMREEVGRSIGLSARKVQIWFQNQRQKMRRPKTHVEVNATSPSESFHGPPTLSGQASRSDPGPSLSATSQRTSPEGVGAGPVPGPHGPSEYDRLILPGYPPSGSYHGSYEAISMLQGPGVPGPSSAPIIGYRDSPRPSTGHSSYTTSGYSSYDGHSPTAPIFAHSLPAQTVRRDPSRTLPPLVFVPSAPGSSQRSSHSSSSASLVSPIAPFVDHDQTRLSPTGSLGLRPPFALEPHPQWEPSSFNAPLRASSLAGSRSSGHSTSPSSPRRPQPSEDHSPAEVVRDGRSHDHDSPRVGRYDPIRDDFIPISPNDQPHRPSQSP